MEPAGAAAIDMARVESLVADRIVAALVGDLESGLSGRKQFLSRLAAQIASRVDANAPDGKTFHESVVEEAASQIVRAQKAEAAAHERKRVLRAIRSPQAEHILAELRELAARERAGKRRGGSTIPLLNKAFLEYGSFDAILQAAEAAS